MMFQSKIKNLLKDFQGHHSEFQIDNFVIKSAGDLWAQYKQTLREISARYETVLADRESLLSMREKLDKIVQQVNGDKRKSVMYSRGVRDYQKKLNNAKDVKRELERFVGLALELKEEIGELTEEKRYQLETKSWAAKGLKMAAIDIMASGRISNQTYDFLFALPKESMVDIIKKLSSKKPMELLGFEPD